MQLHLLVVLLVLPLNRFCTVLAQHQPDSAKNTIDNVNTKPISSNSSSAKAIIRQSVVLLTGAEVAAQVTEEAKSSSDHDNSQFQCPKGFQIDAGVCTDIDECRDNSTTKTGQEEDRRDICGNYVHSHRPGYRCVNTPGSYRCERIVDCGFGYILNETVGVCVDVDECVLLGYEAACGTSLAIKVCINLEGTFRCEYRSCGPGKHLDRETGRCNPCPRGYTKTPRDTCTDVNECERVSLNKCKPHMRCVNFEGGYECKDKIFCPMGRRANYNGTKCIDIDECTEQAGICGLGRNCVNTDGEYRCELKQCSKQQELDVHTGNCKCVDGFRMSVMNESCEDINECDEGSHNCEQNDVCRNTRGHFDCLSKDKVCDPGFGLNFDRSKCVDIDECKLGQFKCGPNEYCNNTHGSYTCICREGFQRLGFSKKCTDIDECVTQNPVPCPSPLLCVNTVGSFACRCPVGYRPEPRIGSPGAVPEGDPRTVCQDVNECTESPGICGPAGGCKNSPPGGYTCTCASGYMSNKIVGGTCVDINECELEACPPTAVCTNLPGDYVCKCGSGLRYIKVTNVCEDIDECKLATNNSINNINNSNNNSISNSNNNNSSINSTRAANSPCPVGLSCFNYKGYFACYNSTCPTGFRMNAQNSVNTYCDALNGSCSQIPNFHANATSASPPLSKLCVSRHRLVQTATEVSVKTRELVTIQSDLRSGSVVCLFKAISTLTNNSTVTEVSTSGNWQSTTLRYVQFKQQKAYNKKYTICSTSLRNAWSGQSGGTGGSRIFVKQIQVMVALIGPKSAEISEHTIYIVRH